ncbi:lipid A deacylase LpxR family protein [Taibaiella lutea]|uniref:Lipid A deacylase LpxR family protein n=1 Tax=Taibaiella lutea TaxID=2608001 RepID=A0A5M6CHB0_9BACT|nr:lipid A deacylase LpxR family protein [Taibaiella lutea]KAA5532529.1 lipid A deacylase LpxR family protein [Taibaiella lutea]
MLRFIKILCALLCLALAAKAQKDSVYHHMFRVYDNNDIFKLLGDVSDKGYTNGTGIEFYYTKDHTSRFFLDKWMPKAEAEAINTFGISVTQDMYTPSDISTSQPDVRDWPYSGALYFTHSLHSYNPLKKYKISSEIVSGVMGKGALTKQMQTFIHSFIASDKPSGWGKTYPTDVLLNINLNYEHAIWSAPYLEILGGGNAMLGTMLDGASAYSYIRVGKMVPYFDNFISRFAKPFGQKNHLQFYLFAKPMLEWIAYDAVLQGGVFEGKSDYYKDSNALKANHDVSRSIEYGLSLSFGPVGLSFSQTTMSRLEDGLQHQRVGSLAVQVAF